MAILCICSHSLVRTVERTPGFSCLCMHKIFPEILGNRVILVFFRVMATCSDSDEVLISLGLTHNLHRQSIQWLEAIEKWPCSDCLTSYSAMLRDDVLIVNIKYMVASLCKIMEQWNCRRRTYFRGHNISWVKFLRGQIFVGGGSPWKFNPHEKLFTGK